VSNLGADRTQILTFPQLSGLPDATFYATLGYVQCTCRMQIICIAAEATISDKSGRPISVRVLQSSSSLYALRLPSGDANERTYRGVPRSITMTIAVHSLTRVHGNTSPAGKNVRCMHLASDGMEAALCCSPAPTPMLCYSTTVYEAFSYVCYIASL
jgi:hypothetical protein